MKTIPDSRPRWLMRFEADYHFRNLFTSYLSVQTFFVHGENLAVPALKIACESPRMTLFMTYASSAECSPKQI